MIGFLTGATVRGIVARVAESSYSPNGQGITSFNLGVGGNQQRGIKGMFVTCKVWGDENFPIVQEAISQTGLAVIADGILTEHPSLGKADGKPYANVGVNVFRLEVQLSKDDNKLTEIKLIRQAKKKVEAEPVKVS